MSKRLRGLSVAKRRELVEREAGVKLDMVKETILEPGQVLGRNIENMIGGAQVPLGVAGPIKIQNSKREIRNYYVPLATTEGALIASVSRGCKAINLSGGVKVEVSEVGVSRGPVFKIKRMEDGVVIESWLKVNEELIKKTTEGTDKHLSYLGFKSQRWGRNVWVRFCFDTEEAMGMNMVTVASQAIVELMEKKLPVKCVALSGNACVDKKVAGVNMICGRGKRVWAEVVVPAEVAVRLFKVNTARIVEVVKRKVWLGSAAHGAVGMNGHFANVVAAMFLATGQDLGHVGECSVGFVDVDIDKNEDLYFAVYLPDMMVGVVGGGTGLPTQQEALAILGVDRVKKGGARELAGVIGGAVLAGELSLMGALAAGQLAKAHEKYGRGKIYD